MRPGRPISTPSFKSGCCVESWNPSWFGDQDFSEPAFYSYTSPEPHGLADRPLSPGSAEWVQQGDSHLAVLRYDQARRASDPRQTVLGFYEAAYQAGARLAGWDVDRYACEGGATDPYARL